MIHVTIKTKRVYSHDGNGMPKFETVDTTLEDGAEFSNFLKYLPMKNFISDELKIVSVMEDGKEIEKSKWEKMLIDIVQNIDKVEPTIDEKYESEKRRNDELEARLQELEKMIPKKAELKPERNDLTELKKRYTEKTGKKPYHGWDAETLNQKINE